jgi:Flp pilus assembly protein TadD
VFALLTIYEPTEPRFWFARGAAEQQRRNLEAAKTCYCFAGLLDGTDPWPLVHLGECLILDGDRESAAEALNRAVLRAREAGDLAAAQRALGFLQDRKEASHAR